jgi:hypothetical protein
MTAKEKAKELFMINFEITVDDYCAKQCALIAVDIAIKCCKDYDEVHENYTTQVNYWQEVKNELNKL